VVTAKPAIRGHFKTGHRDWAKTRLFYSPEGVAGKVVLQTDGEADAGHAGEQPAEE